ncbi:hypothetical protein C9374_003845 [Naegleria lovaniensis]|uniref:Uncharacterized protein n=1 Tax=Naegleria lovaniensis TaxID=51637 RepID=A0AA88H5M4_NAELO|nr:uncharacterized protein C9374_003845 [Naegleria lovaniensis]KAG2394081.1 hypothetical protein C9374_003845 [Naegleria lovaniensis]
MIRGQLKHLTLSHQQQPSSDDDDHSGSSGSDQSNHSLYVSTFKPLPTMMTSSGESSTATTTSSLFKFSQPSPTSSPTTSSGGPFSSNFGKSSIMNMHQNSTKSYLGKTNTNQQQASLSFFTSSSSPSQNAINRKNNSSHSSSSSSSSLNLPINFSIPPIRGANVFRRNWRSSSGGFLCNLSYIVLGIVFILSLFTFFVFIYYTMTRNRSVNRTMDMSNAGVTGDIQGKLYQLEKHSVLRGVDEFFKLLHKKNSHHLGSVPLEEGYNKLFEHEQADIKTSKVDKLSIAMQKEMENVRIFYTENPIQKVFVGIVNDHTQLLSTLILAKQEKLIPQHMALPILHLDSHSGHKILQSSKLLKLTLKSKKRTISKIEKLLNAENFISTCQYYNLIGGHVIWVHNDWTGTKFALPRGRHIAVMGRRGDPKRGKSKICYKKMRGIFWDGTLSDLTFETTMNSEGKIYVNEKTTCTRTELLVKPKHVRWDVYSIDQIARLNTRIFNNTPYILHVNEDFFTAQDPLINTLLPHAEYGHLFDMLAKLVSPKKICYQKAIPIPTKEDENTQLTNEEQNRDWISKILDEMFFRGLVFESDGIRAPQNSLYSPNLLDMWCEGPHAALEELRKLNKLVLIMLDNIPYYVLSLLRYEYEFPSVRPYCAVNNLFGICPSASTPSHPSTDVEIRRSSNYLKDIVVREGRPAIIIISRSNRDKLVDVDKFYDTEHMLLSAIERALSPTPPLIHYLSGAIPAQEPEKQNDQTGVYQQEMAILENIVENEMTDFTPYYNLIIDRMQKFSQLKKFIKDKDLTVNELFTEGQELLHEFIQQTKDKIGFENPIMKTPYQPKKSRVKICMNLIGVKKLIPNLLKCLLPRSRQEKRVVFLVSEHLVETQEEFRQVISTDTQISKVSDQVKQNTFVLLMDLGCDNLNRVLIQSEKGLAKYFSNMQQTVDGKIVNDIAQGHLNICSSKAK